MREGHSSRRRLIALCLALLLLLGWGSAWGPIALPGTTALAQTEGAVRRAAGDDAEKLKVALDVLESHATALRKTYETNKDCRALRQAQDVVEALLVLAPAGSESYRRGKAEWDRTNSLIPRCNPTVVTPRAGGAAGASVDTVVIRGGGGCTNGLLAELLTQDKSFVRDYAERARIEMDVTAVSDADRILLDVTPGERGQGVELPYRTIQAQCDPKGPGVTGLSDVILSYNLMTKEQQVVWSQEMPKSITDLFPTLAPVSATPFPWIVGVPFTAKPTRSSFGPGFGTPAPAVEPGAWGILFPVNTQSPP